MTHLSLFSGIGGLDLAAEWAGFETVGQCEWADYPTQVLERHWPDVPRWRDIRTLTGDDFYEKTGLRTVDIISGGFPCQPFSVAGKQKGKGDDRYLWPEMLRVIRELKPRWVVGENVPGILRIAAADIVQDLEREGFECVLFDFEAASVGAPHRRERIAFVAHRNTGFGIGESEEVCSRGNAAYNGGKNELAWTAGWQAEPAVGRVDHGVPDRVDRIKALGNAVCPPQFYPIFKAIREEMSR
jgi:DNA (cytosine-5)-methyltransferase 1